MPISDNDEQLARRLIELLNRYGAGWVAAEVEEQRQARGNPDPEADAAMLLAAISQTLGLVPELLRDGATRLREVAESPDGILLGNTEIPFHLDSLEELDNLARSAAELRAPILDLLTETRAEEEEEEGEGQENDEEQGE